MLNMFKINNFSDSRREGGRTQKSQVYLRDDRVLWLELPPFCPAVDATVGRAGSGELFPPQTRVPVPPEQQCQTGGQRGTNQGRYVEGHTLSRVWGFCGRKRCKYLCSVHSNQREALCSKETHAHKHHQFFMWWTEGKYLKDTENFLILIKRVNNELFVFQIQIKVIV